MKRLLVVLIVLILVSGGLAGCASAESEVSPLTTTPTSAPETAPDVSPLTTTPTSAPETAPDVSPLTTTPTSAPETAPDVVQEKVKDIETIMGRAEMLGIKVQLIVHEGSSVTISCQADSYTTFRDYLTALEESGRFSTHIPLPEGPPYVTGGSIKLEPKYQYIDMPAASVSKPLPSVSKPLPSVVPSTEKLYAEYDEVNLSLAPLEISEALDKVVGIAEENGINVDPRSQMFNIPPPSPPGERKIGENTYQVLALRDIKVKGSHESVMAFISDLDSRKTLRTMVLTRVSISQIEVDSKIETCAIVDVDIYTIES
ncbi:hypothetical protein ACFLXJ_06870 [Chloroflexota bacterium]